MGEEELVEQMLELNEALRPKIWYCHVNEKARICRLPLKEGMLESRVLSQRSKSGGGGVQDWWPHFQSFVVRAMAAGTFQGISLNY